MKILYYSLIDWKWIKQRPHFICIHLCKQGAKLDFAYPSIIGKSIIKKNYFVKNVEDISIPKIQIRQFPKESLFSLIKTTNNIFKHYQIKKLLRHGGYDVIVLTHPNQYSELFAPYPIVFDMMDDYSSFKNVPNIIAYLRSEEVLCTQSKAIIVSSLALKRLLEKRYPDISEKIHVIHNAYDIEDGKSSILVEESQRLGKRLVYVGTVSSWIDYDTLLCYSKKHPEDRIQMIGPIEGIDESIKTSLRNQSNIELTGAVEYGTAQAYIAAGDIMMIPFSNCNLIHYVDPIKVYEYIFHRKPIVSSYWEEMDKFSDFVEFYDPRHQDGFVSAVERAVVKKITFRQYEMFINLNNWDVRVKEYLRVLISSINY